MVMVKEWRIIPWGTKPRMDDMCSYTGPYEEAIQVAKHLNGWLSKV